MDKKGRSDEGADALYAVFFRLPGKPALAHTRTLARPAYAAVCSGVFGVASLDLHPAGLEPATL